MKHKIEIIEHEDGRTTMNFINLKNKVASGEMDITEDTSVGSIAWLSKTIMKTLLKQFEEKGVSELIAK